jgi:Suppressor of fused protein (SUFU)
MNGEVVYPALRSHIGRFFKGHRRYEYEYPHGPAGRVPPGFRVVRVAAGPKSPLNVYLSVGAWEATGETGHGLEFLVAASQPEVKCVELLAMVAYYHRTEGLGVGHTFPLGYGWLGGSCDHMLVSLPYPFGPKLEVCCLEEEGHVRFLWLLPITAAEKRFRHEHGLEALEQRFDEAKLNFAFPYRQSVV